MDTPSWPILVPGLAVVFTSLLFLPLTLTLVLVSYALQALVSQNYLRKKSRISPRFRPRKILITGIATPQGLHIARAFYLTGHDIIGADFVSTAIPLPVRFSKAIGRLYRLRPFQQEGSASYVEDLLGIVAADKVDVWINCSSTIPGSLIAQTKEVIECRTACTCLALLTADAAKLSTRDGFLNYAKEIGLPTPEVHRVASRAEIHQVLGGAKGKKIYVLAASNGKATVNPRTMLPRRTLSQTYGEISKLTINKDETWILEQHFVSGEQYTTYAIVVGGKVVAFAASALAENAASQQGLSTESGLGRAMLQFTQTLADVAGKGFTSQLSITFKVDEKTTETGVERNIFPIDCKTSAQAPVLLFTGDTGAVSLVNSYLSALVPAVNGDTPFLDQNSGEYELATPSDKSAGIYFIGQELPSLILKPFLKLLQLRIGFPQFVHTCLMFFNHVAFWREGTFCTWDPLPFFWLYHIYIPLRCLDHALKQTSWDEHDAFMLQ